MKEILCLAVLAAMAGVPSGRSASAPPNVVLIVCDDRNEAIGCLGGHSQARTPNLARTGVSFRRACSNNPVCAPARSSFLTGIYPHASGNLFFKPVR